MLSFIMYKDALEQLEIVADEEGLDDLILYLQSVRRSKNHMHLIIDSELDPYPLSKDNVYFARSVKIEFEDTKN